MQIHELPSGTPDIDDAIPFDTGGANYKAPFSLFEVGENTATFESSDEADPQQFKTVDQVETGPVKTILNRLSMAVSNVRYIWKVLSALVSKTAIINYNDVSAQFNITHDNTHKFVLNKGGSGTYELFRVDVGDANMQMDNSAGIFDVKLDNSVKHRIYMSDDSNQNYPEMMVIRCADSYIEKPSGMDRLNLAAGDGAYLAIGSNTSDGVDGRAYMVAPGGFFINGVRNGISAYSSTYTTSAGGNFSIGFSKKCVVLAAYCTSSDTLVLPYPTANTGTSGATTWWFHVQSTTGSAVASTSVTVTVFYMFLE